ncbi:MAG: hypothetical protein PHD74_10455, partial [Candidatus Krumholzibacteria bacterium]|nr:hypothetical protein [Candidatus Krumholzibacteria bacterium]
VKFIIPILIVLIVGCEEGGMAHRNSRYASLEAVPKAGWDSLACKSIFFGHQSVGRNIVDGIRDVMRLYPDIRLNVRETASPEDFDGAVFAHWPIGENKDPRSKIDHFRRILESGVGRRADMAFFKLCYVDVGGDTDVEAVFHYYEETVRSLEKEFPNLKIVTVTVPLTTRPAGLKARISEMRGRTLWSEEDNIKRNVLNGMLRKEFGASVFDLAGFESSSSGGGKTSFKKDGETYYILNHAYSDDGGHLNKTGRSVIAAEMLAFLAGTSR